ncbi:MAG: NAD-dependent deacylase [Bacteroidales bacterium]|nr:NAD-dependent deacylase [Bacteroidales bacterium]
MVDLLEINLDKAAEVIKNASHITAFTGAGISVESGIPSYRGKDGLWTKYDTKALEISFFYSNPVDAWEIIRKIFYEYFGKAKPNAAHSALAKMEKKGMLKAVITQNIDNLHYEAGNETVFEFHGNSKVMLCTKCKRRHKASSVNLDEIPPKCIACGGLLKPDFIFFGEGIPQEAYKNSFAEAEKADVFLLIGTTGLVQPAAYIPIKAKQNGATIIEVNPERTAFTEQITDIFLQGKAGEVMTKLSELIFTENEKL